MERQYIDASMTLAVKDEVRLRRSVRRLRLLFVSLIVLVLAVVTMTVLLFRAL